MIEKSSLLIAVLNRNLPKVEEIVKHNGDKIDIFSRDDCGRNYLHLSVFLRNQELVNYFLAQGINANDSDNENLTPLHRACRNGSVDIVRILLKNGANCNAKANNSITPLHIAAYYGHLACVQLLCSEELVPFLTLKLNPKDDEDHTPLHYAAAEGNVSIAWELIKNGCNVPKTNSVGNTPLHFAAAAGTPMLCQILISYAGASPDAQNYKGQTPLHIAVIQSCSKTVDALLKDGADPNIRDASGNTSLHLAFKSGHIDSVDCLLMDKRCDTSISDDEENTVLHLALKLGHYNMIPDMLPLASDLTRQNASGCTVIIEAIKNQLEDLAIDMLRVCPSLVHKSTLELVTPLHLAAERGMTNLTRQLLIAGAHVDATDSSGLTPSLYCAKNDSVLECLSMIEDLMMVSENPSEENGNGHKQHTAKGNGSKISSRISS